MDNILISKTIIFHIKRNNINYLKLYYTYKLLTFLLLGDHASKAKIKN